MTRTSIRWFKTHLDQWSREQSNGVTEEIVQLMTIYHLRISPIPWYHSISRVSSPSQWSFIVNIFWDCMDQAWSTKTSLSKLCVMQCLQPPHHTHATNEYYALLSVRNLVYKLQELGMRRRRWRQYLQRPFRVLCLTFKQWQSCLIFISQCLHQLQLGS